MGETTLILLYSILIQTEDYSSTYPLLVGLGSCRRFVEFLMYFFTTYWS